MRRQDSQTWSNDNRAQIRRRQGFTIVELLVVIVLIAILAVITIVAYNGIQERARTAAVSSALNQASKKLEIYNVDNATFPSSLATVGINDGTVTYQYSFNATTPSYCITATQGTTSYWVSSTATLPAKGGCPGHGQGGAAPLTNLAINPSVETNGTGWTNRWYGSGGSGTLALSAAAAQSGSMGYRKTWTVAGGGQDIGMSYVISGLSASKTYSFSAYVRDSLAAGQRPMLEWRDGAGTKIGSTIMGTEVATGANTWRRLTMTETAPANTSSALFIWGPYPMSGTPTSTVGRTVDFDSLMVTESSSVATYADGSSANWAWNGTAHASTSSGPAL